MAKYNVTAAKTKMLPNTSRLLSAETGHTPKVSKSTVSAPKQKLKFGKHLAMV